MRTRIKICCMASFEEAQLAIQAGADAVGLVGAMPSGPGVIEDRAIAAIAARVPPPIATFLLTSVCTAAGIAQQVRATAVSTVQIVSHIDPSESEQLPKLFSRRAAMPPRIGLPKPTARGEGPPT